MDLHCTRYAEFRDNGTLSFQEPSFSITEFSCLFSLHYRHNFIISFYQAATPYSAARDFYTGGDKLCRGDHLRAGGAMAHPGTILKEVLGHTEIFW